MKKLETKMNLGIVIVSTIIFILFMAIVLPHMNELTEEFAQGLGSIDTGFVYNLDEFASIRDGYGEFGRSEYIRIRWTYDVLWPFVYTFFIGSATLLITKKFKFSYKFVYVILFGMHFDFLENSLATIYMFFYESELTLLVYLLMIASSIKWILIMGSFGLLVVLPILYYLKRKKVIR